MLDRVNFQTNKTGELDLLIGERAFWSDFRYLRGAEIFGEAEPAEYVYKIRSGSVRTFKLLPDGRRQIGAFHLPGDIFGVESGEAYRFTAEAIEDTAAWIAKRRRIFGECPDENVPTSKDVLKLIARSLQHAENHLLLLGRQTSLEKVAAFLTEMDQRLHSPAVMILPMGRRDIADYLGLTIETVSRVFSILERERILSFEGLRHREIVLHSRAKLARLALFSELKLEYRGSRDSNLARGLAV
jgi:CRP/FNR family transcriptional regulator, nitrogen fixation regulation protein